jgi:hypothetical protein
MDPRWGAAGFRDRTPSFSSAVGSHPGVCTFLDFENHRFRVPNPVHQEAAAASPGLARGLYSGSMETIASLT